MAQTILRIDELVSDPNIHDGQVMVKDSEVRVIDVVHAYDPKDKESARKLAIQFGVQIGQVYASMTYYHLHKNEFES